MKTKLNLTLRMKTRTKEEDATVEGEAAEAAVAAMREEEPPMAAAAVVDMVKNPKKKKTKIRTKLELLTETTIIFLCSIDKKS